MAMPVGRCKWLVWSGFGLSVSTEPVLGTTRSTRPLLLSVMSRSPGRGAASDTAPRSRRAESREPVANRNIRMLP